MSRWLLTLCTTLTLFGAFRVYSHFLAPLTQIKHSTPIPRLPDEDTVRPTTSFAAGEAARTHLPNSDWAEHAEVTWQRGDFAFLYTNTYSPIDDDQKNKVSFQPFALIWKDEKHPEAQPFILTAEKARITFQHKFTNFDLTGDPGRIVGAALEGEVRLRGPDGLVLKGSNFTFSEKDLTLYSDDELEFAHGPSSDSPSRIAGRSRGISIRLTPGMDDFLGDDLPRIVDFESVTLYRDVRFDAIYAQDGEQTPVRVESKGAFNFDRAQQLASFDENVEVIRFGNAESKNPGVDSLTCRRLELHFENEAPAENVAVQKPQKDSKEAKQSSWEKRRDALSDLRFHFMRALSPPDASGAPSEKVTVRSEANNLSGEMQEVQFDSFSRNLTVTDPAGAIIEYGLTKLLVKNLLVGLDEKQQLSVAFCDGPGRIQQRDKMTGEVALTAAWSRRMEFHPDDDAQGASETADRLADLNGDVEVALGDRGGLWADRLRLWIPADSVEQLQESPAKPGSGLPIRRILAEGKVGFAGSGAQGSTRSLDVSLTAGIPPLFSQPETSQKSPTADREQKKTEKEDGPLWNMDADRIAVDLIVDPESLESAPSQVTAEGRLRLEREAEKKSTNPTEGPILVQGRHLTVVNAGGTQQVITLLGTEDAAGRASEPAHFHSGATHLEGKKIEVDRTASKITVSGHPVLQWPVDSDLMGRSLRQGRMMNIECGDTLTFDGKEARFLSRVRVSLEESRLRCDQLIARLNQPIDLTGAVAPTGRPELREIACRAPVSLEMHEFNGSEIVRRLQGDLGDFMLNRETGEFHGKGPGLIEEWRKGGMHVTLAASPKAAANQQATTTELPWAYTKLDFKGSFAGNIKDGYGQIDERVKAIYAPVAKVNQTFERGDLSLQTPTAERAVWMGCKTLKIMLTETKDDARPFFVTLQAEDGAQLEGQTIHANAHQISFEQEKDLLNLRGRGLEKASVYFETEEDGEYTRHALSGTSIKVCPSTRTTSVDNSGTIQ